MIGSGLQTSNRQIFWLAKPPTAKSLTRQTPNLPEQGAKAGGQKNCSSIIE
jgi:hypothetical protein